MPVRLARSRGSIWCRLDMVNLFVRTGMGLRADGGNKELIKLAGLDTYSFVDADGDVPVPPTKRKGKKGKVLVTQEEATKLDDAVPLSDVSTVIAMPAEAVAEFLRRTDDESDSESDLELDSSPEVSDSDVDDF